ncbi:Uncharacterized protein Adt_18679 [Abeliophyllum distichum]|uniref:Uncharacterized protein n=1 Tax=Abeliophyllum distichum TaxID=126358 RepID=A0ABD1TK31_9LAMI
MNEQASTMMNSQSQLQQQQQIMAMNQNQMMSMSQMNAQPQQQMMMNRSYGMWAPPTPQPQFQNPNTNLIGMKPPPSVTFNKSKKKLGLGPRSNWNGKKVGKPNDKRRKDQQLQQKPLMPGSSTGAPSSGINVISSSGNMNFNYNPPTLNELQHQNRLKSRKFFPKKNFNKNNNMISSWKCGFFCGSGE